ncbi:MAG: hydrogenase expression/formation protein HypE [Candidatus Goldiibacteriota bacterium]
MDERIITLAHGAGGRKTKDLIDNIISGYFGNPVMDEMNDSAVLKCRGGQLAFTTDSFVVTPLFFSGGDIGKLSVCGTVNDIAASGARPAYLTAAFIIEDGLPVSYFRKILVSMKKACDESGVKIAGGDTKVVERGKADGIYINTSGIGFIPQGKKPVVISGAKPGDAVIVSGNIGDHEIAVMKDRKLLSFESGLKSDCAPLGDMIKEVLDAGLNVNAMRDPTRGGLASVLNEMALSSKVDIRIDEKSVPVSRPVKAACSVFGFDVFGLANEGKMVFSAGKKDAGKILAILKKSKYGKKASVIGEVERKSTKPKVRITAAGGGDRLLFFPDGGQLPRIC